MTREEKIQKLINEVDNNNILIKIIKTKFPAIAANIPDEELDWYITEIDTYKQSLPAIIESAINFGNKLIVEFTTQNVIMGITAAGKTKHLRQTLREVTDALKTGSLYDAIDELRLVPEEAKDPVFLTDVRLLAFINKIETYLGITLSTEL